MVDAVRSNPEGLPDNYLGAQIDTCALHVGDTTGAGVSVRFMADL
jgi:hypothetical protein